MYGGPLFVSRRCSAQRVARAERGARRDAGSDETNIVPTLSLFLLWLLNGWLVLLLLPVLIWLVGNAPAEQRPRQILVGDPALSTALLASPTIL
jgi:hypothetical protein